MIKLSSNESPFKIPKKIFVKANKLAEDSNLYLMEILIYSKIQLQKNLRLKKKELFVEMVLMTSYQ